MKLEVGMYVRIQNGLNITKVQEVDYEKEKFLGLFNSNVKIDVGFWNIKKASHNIIDLIEVGDFVNGRQVCFIKDDELYEECIHGMYQIKDIKEILTKEQYEREVYRVKESE